MPARFLVMVMLLSAFGLFAKQVSANEQDTELFEFLAMYDQNDEIFIDSEIDEKINEPVTKQDKVKNLNDTKSESDE